MKNNREKLLTAHLNDLKRGRAIIQARLDTEYDLSKELKHQLWLEAKQVDELIDRLLGGHHGQKQND